jgi:hypothetical protein
MDSAKAVDDIRRSNNFQRFFAKAIEKFEQFESDKDWARQATIAFRRKFGYPANFVSVYYAFINEAEKHNEGYESESVGDQTKGDENSVDSNESYERDGFVVDDDKADEGEQEESEDEWKDDESESIASEHEEEDEEEEPRQPQTSLRSSARINQSQSNAAPEETPIDEAKQGRQILNKIIFKEYNAWYQAFQDEAKEDSSNDAMTADERFQWHCAKVLSRKTDIRAKEIYPIIGAWLHEHHNA